MLVSGSSKLTFERYRIFQLRGNRDTIKGKIMQVAPMRIDNKKMTLNRETAKMKLRQYDRLLKSPNCNAVHILIFYSIRY